MNKDVYFSVDVETDGPIPGPYSMSAIGLAAVATFDGSSFTRLPVDETTWYRELKPISEHFVPEAAAVAGLDRDALIRDGQAPEHAMVELAGWLRRSAERLGGRPVFVGYPLGFDWLFTYWYLVRYADSPFGHSAHLDMKSMYARTAGVPISRATKRYMPKELRSSRKHTHNALDDAKEQGELFCNLFQWSGPAGPVGSQP